MNQQLALIFGGSRGICAACVRMLVRDGFDVAFTNNSNADQAKDVASTISQAFPSARVTFHQVDIRRADTVASVFAGVA